jgi:hypothetical protein
MFYGLINMYVEEMSERYKKNHVKEEEFFVDENLREKTTEEPSPSGRYLLKISYYKTAEGCWDYSRGRVYDKNHNLIADVKRNYASFQFAWAEGHPNGHDYLVCGEDYQLQTVIELDTGKRVDAPPTEAYMQGNEFCWVHVVPSPNRLILAVSGCNWGDAYYIDLYDFKEPMKMPYPKIAEHEDVFLKIEKWETDDKLLLYRTIDVRKSTGKELTPKDWDEMSDDELDNDTEERKVMVVWNTENGKFGVK